MSLPADQILISADDHLVIHEMPVDVWSALLPKQWSESGPRVRCAKLGHRGAIVSDTVGRGAPIFEDAWAPFWDAAQEIGIPIHVHLAGGLHSLKMGLGSWRMPAYVAVVPMQLDETLAGMI